MAQQWTTNAIFPWYGKSKHKHREVEIELLHQLATYYATAKKTLELSESNAIRGVSCFIGGATNTFTYIHLPAPQIKPLIEITAKPASHDELRTEHPVLNA